MVRARGSGWRQGNSFLDTTWQLHIWTHCSCGCIHTLWVSLSQTKCWHGRGREGTEVVRWAQSPTPEWGSTGLTATVGGEFMVYSLVGWPQPRSGPTTKSSWATQIWLHGPLKRERGRSQKRSGRWREGGHKVGWIEKWSGPGTVGGREWIWSK